MPHQQKNDPDRFKEEDRDIGPAGTQRIVPAAPNNKADNIRACTATRIHALTTMCSSSLTLNQVRW